MRFLIRFWAATTAPGIATRTVQVPVRVNVTWVTPVGEELASTL